MESIISKMAKLSVEGDKKKKLGAYYKNLKKNKTFWKVPERNEFVVSDEFDKKYMFLKALKCTDDSSVLVCSQCMNTEAISKVNISQDF